MNKRTKCFGESLRTKRKPNKTANKTGERYTATSGPIIRRGSQFGEVLTSDDMLGRITEKGVRREHARQLLNRAAGREKVWRSETLVLPGGSRIFATTSFKQTPEFVTAAVPVLQRVRPGLARCIKVLRQQEVLLRQSAELLLATPVDASRAKYPSFEHEIECFDELGAGKLEGKDTALERVSSREIAQQIQSHAAALNARSRAVIEDAVAQIVIERFREQNAISWNSAELGERLGALVDFNNFLFHRSAFSFLRPMLKLRQGEKAKPTPVVMDVYARCCTEPDVESFVERMVRAGQNKNSRLTFLGIVAANDFEPLAWKKAKSEGLLTINLQQYFGDAAFRTFAKLQELLKDVVGNPEQANERGYDQLANAFEALKTNPYVVDLRSIGFEVLTGLLLRADCWEDAHLNLKVPFNTTDRREIDVFAHKRSKEMIIIIECKAARRNKKLDPGDVRKFLTETVPAFLKSKHIERQPIECKAEIWTTGEVGIDAQNELSSIPTKPFVTARLLGHADILKQVPHSLSDCKRLIEAISIDE